MIDADLRALTFELSGQSQVEFCAEHDLNPAYFSKRRGELLSAQSEPAFVQVQSRSSCNCQWPLLLIRFRPLKLTHLRSGFIHFLL